MKNAIIVVLVTLLTAAGYVIAKERTKPVAAISGGDGSVQRLPAEAEKALGLADKEAVLALVNFDGSIQYFYSSKAEYKEDGLPKTPVTLKRVESVNMVIHSASPNCITVIQNGRPYTYCPK